MPLEEDSKPKFCNTYRKHNLASVHFEERNIKLLQDSKAVYDAENDLQRPKILNYLLIHVVRFFSCCGIE